MLRSLQKIGSSISIVRGLLSKLAPPHGGAPASRLLEGSAIAAEIASARTLPGFVRSRSAAIHHAGVSGSPRSTLMTLRLEKRLR